MKRSGFFYGVPLFAALSIAWTWYAGKDLNWDFINYHFYGAYQLLDHRLDKDYFAASLQSYLNPLGYVPLYAMIRSGWNPLAIGLALSLVHSLNFAFIWLISDRLLPEQTRHRILACVISVCIAFLAPLQLTTLGGTPLDPVTSLPVLAALYLLLAHAGNLRTCDVFWIGLLFGLASGLKLTNLLLLPAALIAVEIVRNDLKPGKTFRRAIVFSAASGLGLLLTHGYWSYELWQTFSNPVFPLLNGLFQSPDFPAASFQDRRFLSTGLMGIITLPVQMLEHTSAVYAENVAPDVRPLILCILLMLFVVQRIFRANDSKNINGRNRNIGLRAILAFALVFYLVWASVSRIGRYAYVLWLLVGPLATVIAFSLPWKRVSYSLLAAAILIQMVFLYSTGNPRWTAVAWGDRWLDVDVPPKLQNDPYSYLTIGTLSLSAVIPYFNENARFANLAGQYMQPAGERMTPKFKQFLASDLPIKTMFSVGSGFAEKLTESKSKDINNILSIYGLRLASVNCDKVNVGLTRLQNFQSVSANKENFAPEVQTLAVCDIVRSNPNATVDALKQMKQIDEVFERVEDTCPELLNPVGVQTMRGGAGWMRTYFNSNTQLLSDGNFVFIRNRQVLNDVVLGTLSEWRESVPNSKCNDRFRGM